MNYITHLTLFFERSALDVRLNTTHISMYMSLFQFWNLNRFQNPISISRSEVMKVSKISAIATYHKCIKELNAYGYIIYEPSYNPFKGSMVRMIDFENRKIPAVHQDRVSNNEQVSDKLQTSSDTGSEQALVPYINNNKRIKQNKLFKTLPEEYSKFEQVKKIEEKENISVTKFKPPHISEIKMYFAEKEAPQEEAEKFFNHYESNGWLVGGKSKMKNWEAAARNWLLNSKKFNIQTKRAESKPGHLNAAINKSYQEKL